MSTSTVEEYAKTTQIEELETVTIRFCGDSGDGMQLTGTQFTSTAAVFGNDISTLPDFPAEIRAPQGSLPGVSGFQLNFSSREIHTPGDELNALVAMNPAALKTNVADLEQGGILLVNENEFNAANFKKASITTNPLEDGSLSAYRLFKLPITDLTLKSVEEFKLPFKVAERAKNFYALGLVYWLYDRSLEQTEAWIQEKFGNKPEIAQSNLAALRAGYNYADTTEIFTTHYRVSKAKIKPGKYRNITGNQATAIGFITAANLAGLPLFYGSYPITPASDVLHELAKHKHFGVKTFQAEDEIAAIGAAIGAAFTGSLGLTGTSGPGVALKSEAIGLAVMTELPLVIINVQRGGPSTGLPTKTEQSDLLQAMFGRNGECPVGIVAAATPGDCFNMAVEAVRLATKFMSPVFFLSDGYLGNGSEPWLIPDLDKLPEMKVTFRTEKEGFMPYARDERTLARPWAVPGTPGLEHRIGGIEKQNITGNVNYEPENHEFMVRLRQEKIDRMALEIPALEVNGEAKGKVLVLGWGSTYGAIATAVEQLQAEGQSVSSAHLRYLNPFPSNLGEVLKNFETVIIPELNMGQLALLIRAKFLVDAVSYTKIKGKPFKVTELVKKIKEHL
jgi:2-oxoglutarate ferredoxin oxidoreductase subunit alpha